MVFNYKKPIAVLYAGSHADVSAAITFAAERQLPVCARAGGHDHAGASICDGGIVVDVSNLKQVNMGRRVRIGRLERGPNASGH